jgi:hypothetical protein
VSVLLQSVSMSLGSIASRVDRRRLTFQNPTQHYVFLGSRDLAVLHNPPVSDLD